MARRILSARLARIGCAFWFVQSLSAAASPTCSGADAGAADDLLAAAHASPLHALLEQRGGAASNCRIQVDGQQQSLWLTFPGQAELELIRDPSIEYLRETVTFPANGAAIPRATLVSQLKALERQAAAPEGCGISWRGLERLPAHLTGEWKAEGSSCNCKAAVQLRKGLPLRIRFSMAC